MALMRILGNRVFGLVLTATPISTGYIVVPGKRRFR